MKRTQQRALVSRTVLLEFWRRQDFWILLFLMGVFALVVVSARLLGIESPQAGTLMLNMGLTLAGVFAHGLVVVLASRQFPKEVENRTLYPLLARPLERADLWFGKWQACVFCAGGAYVALFLIAWLAAPHLELVSGGTLLQHLLLLPLSLAWAGAFAMALSLCLPGGLAVTISLITVFFGETFFQWGHSYIAGLHLLPRFGALNLVTRYTDGIAPLSLAEWGGAAMYAGLWTLLSVMLGLVLLGRRAL